MTTKTYKGLIEGWYKIPLSDEVKDKCLVLYGETPGLGYLIGGTCIKHPIFGTSTAFTSSWVTRRSGDKVWTRNSRYRLGSPKQ